jgi:CRP-like cAMP-binding protein
MLKRRATSEEPLSAADAALLGKFLQTLPLFAGFDATFCARIAQISQLREFKAGELVYKEHDVAREMFVIVHGAVGNRSLDGLGYDYMEKSMVRQAGDSFGEAALHNKKDERRISTKIACADTTLLAISRDDYQALRSAELTSKFHVKVQFLQTLRMFNQCNDIDEIRRVARACKLMHHEKNSVLVKQNRYADGMYFIVSGEFRVIQRVPLRRTAVAAALAKLKEQREAKPRFLHHLGVRGSGKDKDGAAAPAVASAESRLESEYIKFVTRVHQREKQQKLRESKQRKSLVKLHDASIAKLHGHASSKTTTTAESKQAHKKKKRKRQKQQVPVQLIELARLRPRDFFGELALLHNLRRSAFVYCETPATVLFVSKTAFKTKLPARVIAYFKRFAASFYPNKAQVTQQVTQAQRWDLFRKRMVERTHKEG